MGQTDFETINSSVPGFQGLCFVVGSPFFHKSVETTNLQRRRATRAKQRQAGPRQPMALIRTPVSITAEKGRATRHRFAAQSAKGLARF
jgi:hypothetical protein